MGVGKRGEGVVSASLAWAGADVKTGEPVASEVWLLLEASGEVLKSGEPETRVRTGGDAPREV